MQHLWSGCFIQGREPALALNHHLLSSTARSQLDDAEPVGRQIKKKQFESRLVCHSITLPWECAWAGGGVRRLKWNLRAAITWLRPAPVFSRRLLDISLTSSRHPGKKKPSPAGESQQSLWKRGAAEKPTSDDTWNKFRAEKKGRHTERRGELFWAAARPRAQRILQRAALLCSTFKTKFTFWTLNFSNGPLRSQAISIQGGIEKYTLPYLGLYEKQKWYADTFR